MNCKKILLTAFGALIFSSFSLFGQEDSRVKSKKNAEMYFEKIAQKLSLSEEQEVAFKEIHKKYREQAKSFKKQTQSKEELTDMLYQNKKSRMTEVKDLLTPEQYALYDKIDEERKRKRKARRRASEGM